MDPEDVQSVGMQLTGQFGDDESVLEFADDLQDMLQENAIKT